MALNIGNGMIDNRSYGKTSRTSGASASSAAKSASSASGKYTIGDLKPGLEFRASVSDVNNNTIRLRLSDGQQISARLESPGDFNIGEEITFVVKANDGVQIDITPSKIPTEVNPTLLKALGAADLPVNGDNLSMVQFMMEEQMSVDKGSLMGMYRKILANPEANIQSIVQMSKFNIPITEESLYQFENYKALENQISKELSQLTTSLTKDLDTFVFSKLPDNPQIESSIEGNVTDKNIFASLPSQNEGKTQDTIQNITNPINSRLEAQFENVPEPIRAQFKEMALKLPPEEIARLESVQFTNNYDNLDTILEKINSGDNLESIEYNTTLVNIALDETENLQENVKAEVQIQDNPEILSQTLSKEEMLVLSRDLENAGFPKELADAVKQGEITPEKLLSEVNSKLNNDKGTLLQVLDQTVLSNKTYQKILSNAISKQWFIKPEEVAEEQRVSNLYDKLNKHMKTIEAQAGSLGREVSTTMQLATHTSGNMDFMNQVNQLFSYVQIPLKMNGEDSQSDLYVFSNKKNLNDPDAEIKALLHLDLEACGSVDAFLKLQGTKLDTKFTLETDEVYKLFEDHIDTLIQRLEAKGYNCTVKFDKGKEDVDFVEDFLKQGQSVGTLQRFSFDVRA